MGRPGQATPRQERTHTQRQLFFQIKKVLGESLTVHDVHISDTVLLSESDT